jgi:hypothetical protein
MQCRGENTYIRFLRAFAYSQILSMTLRNCDLKSPVRRDFSIGGSRLADSDETLGVMFNPAGPVHSFHYVLAQEETPLNLSAALSAIDPCAQTFLQLLSGLCMTSFDVMAKVHLPSGPVNETIMSRLLRSREEL